MNLKVAGWELAMSTESLPCKRDNLDPDARWVGQTLCEEALVFKVEELLATLKELQENYAEELGIQLDKDVEWCKNLKVKNLELAELLGLMYDKYEAGTDCYETSGEPPTIEDGAYIGKAVRLSEDEDHRIVKALAKTQEKGEV